jgi:hypothetical protein
VFYADPPERDQATVGRPRRHGARFKCGDPATWPPPDDQPVATDARYGT